MTTPRTLDVSHLAPSAFGHRSVLWWGTMGIVLIEGTMFALVIVLGLVALSGFLLCGIGAAITIPVASAALMYVYEDLFGSRTGGPAVLSVPGP